MNHDFTIRRVSDDPQKDAAEWQAIAEICYQLRADSYPESEQDQRFFAAVWIEPYRQLRPRSTYVAKRDRQVIGYLTGCPDSVAFARAKFIACTLPLLMRLVRGRFKRVARTRSFVRQTLGLQRHPHMIFPSAIKRDIKTHYPAHLHMNVDPSYQRTGVGSALFRSYAGDLRDAGVCGIHLYCASAPLEFYRRLGFNELARTISDGTSVHALGLRLD